VAGPELGDVSGGCEDGGGESCGAVAGPWDDELGVESGGAGAGLPGLRWVTGLGSPGPKPGWVGGSLAVDGALSGAAGAGVWEDEGGASEGAGPGAPGLRWVGGIGSSGPSGFKEGLGTGGPGGPTPGSVWGGGPSGPRPGSVGGSLTVLGGLSGGAGVGVCEADGGD